MSVQNALDKLQQALEVCRAAKTLAQELPASSDDTRSLMYEGILANAFRAHENFIEDLFLEYLNGSPGLDGTPVQSFVTPNDISHARKMLEAQGARFLDWSDTATVRNRCAVFLKSGDPLTEAILGLSSELSWIKRIRNHIAHNSLESTTQYLGAVRAILLVEPVSPPLPGKFLQEIPSAGPVKNREVLAFLLDAIGECARNSAKEA